jgi:hypothetical protein
VSIIVQLPCGYHDEAGHRHREVELSTLSGREEEVLAARSGTPAELVTSVLSKCVRRLGPLEQVGEELTRQLTVGDRQFPLLKVREATFGPSVALVTSCTWPDCGEKVDIDFLIPDVPVRESDAGPIYEVRLSAEALPDTSADADGRLVTFRLPTGADQEICAPLLDTNPAAAMHELLAACVLSIGPDQPPSRERVARLSPLAGAEIESAMAEVAAGPMMTLRAQCPGCGRGFDVPLDVADLFFGEARGSADLLYRQVHYLAYHYHWGESEILSLPRAKRLRYVELLAEEIEAMNDALA